MFISTALFRRYLLHPRFRLRQRLGFGFIAWLAVSGTVLAGDEAVSIQLPEDHFPVLEQILRDSAVISTRMIEERLRVEEAQAEAEVAGAGRLPRVTGAFRYLGRVEDRSDLDGTGSYYEPQGTLIARQPLYHWGALRARQRAGQLGAELAEQAREESYQAQIQEIRAAFLELAIRQMEIRLAKERAELAKEEGEAARRRAERGEATEEELEKIRLNQQETQMRLDRTEQEFSFARNRFLRISGFAPVGDEWMPESIPDPNSEIVRAVNLKDGNPAWREMTELRLEHAEQQVAVEASRHRPKLDFIVGISQDQIAVLDRSDVDRIIYFAGLELTWNIFDGHEARGRKAAAEARRLLELHRKQRLELEAEAEFEQMQQALAWAAAELEIGEKRLELARRTLSQTESDFERGAASAVEVAAARVAVREQEVLTTQRRADYLMVGSELLAFAGNDPAVRFLR